LPPVEDILIEFVILVLSLSFHEAAHAFTATRLGDSTARRLGRLTLNPLAHIDAVGTVIFPLVAMFSGIPLIGWAKPVPVDMRQLRDPRRDFAIVALAGPVSNLVLAVAAAALFKVLTGPDSSAITASPLGPESGSMGWLSVFLKDSVLINVLLAVFNMIPVPPLDGGNVLMGLVQERVAVAISWLRPYGFLILYALMLSGLLFTITTPVRNFLLSWLLPR
jgi:Zn-dependent protease